MTNNKIFLSMAALVFVGAMTAGCSSNDLTAETPQPVNNGTVVMKTTISLSESASTRALTEAGVKTFAAGDQIAVIYKNTAGETVKAESAALQATDLHDAAKTASFSVTLTNPQASTPVRYIYPASMASATVATDVATNDDVTINYAALATQDGTLASLASDLDLAVFDGTLTAQAVLPPATLENPLTICGFTLRDSGDSNADITSSVNSLTISDGTNAYAVSPSGLDAIYVAMKPASGNIAFTAATTASKTYFKTATSKTLTAGTLYTNITVSMVELAVGSVFCSDGSVYASKDAATSASKTPVALICYLGNDAETNAAYKHGLALALADASTYAVWCSQTGATCLGTQYDNETAAKGDMAGIANTDYLINNAPAGHTHTAASAARNYNGGTHPTGTSKWFLPSAGQWDKMINAAGGYNTLKSNASLQSPDSRYWSSTEHSSQNAWLHLFSLGKWYEVTKNGDYCGSVRSALAF